MDEKRLMRETKSELIEMLESRGLEASESSLKTGLVEMILAHERSLKERGEKTEEKKPAKRIKPRKEKEEQGLKKKERKREKTKYSTGIERRSGPPAAIAEPSSGTVREVPERAAVEPPYPTELPSSYGEDNIVLIVRDPYWIFAYWEVTPNSLERARRELGDEAAASKTTLRVYDVTGIRFTGENANSYFDIEISGGADNWYINTGWPNRSYCVDIGLLSPKGRFHPIARSNSVHTPRASASEVVDERWMSLEEEFERMYALSGGFQIGHGSVELRQMMEKQLQVHMASEAVTSLFSMPAVSHKERSFRLAVETELIVYGSTEPGSRVTIQGKPVNLRPDGTFSVRFALPEGKQVIPVTAESPDGVEERTITPTVTRLTDVREPSLK